jgi:ATP-dependent Clp protease protease subunit
MKSKRKPAYKKTVPKQEFDVDLTLLKNRQIFLQEEINDKTAIDINKKLFALDTLNHNPIMLYIDSPGGSCSAGLSIINIMKTIDSPVVTIINSEVCSMGGHISIAGDKRVCYSNSVFMAHDMSTYMEDYSGKIKHRAKFLEKYYDLLEENLRKHTNLTEKELRQARDGELWLFADEMLDKGIVDEIILHDK